MVLAQPYVHSYHESTICLKTNLPSHINHVIPEKQTKHRIVIKWKTQVRPLTANTTP